MRLYEKLCNNTLQRVRNWITIGYIGKEVKRIWNQCCLDGKNEWYHSTYAIYVFFNLHMRLSVVG